MRPLKAYCYKSLIGELYMVADGDRLCYLDFAENVKVVGQNKKSRWDELMPPCYGAFPPLAKSNLLGLRERLDRYFAREWDAFDGLDRCIDGTAFRRAVWGHLLSIPRGTVKPYSKVADEIGRPGANQSVGQANAKNPIAIIVPCHRVIPKNKPLKKYTGGTERQAWLLGHEGVDLRLLKHTFTESEQESWQLGREGKELP